MAVVLKSRVVGNTGFRPERFNLADVQEEADQILRQARLEADEIRAGAQNIISEAEIQAQDIAQKAKEDGFSQGYQEGLAEGINKGTEQALAEKQKEFTEQSQDLQKTLEGLLRQFEQQQYTLISDAHKELLGFAIAVAEKVARVRFECNSEAVLECIRSAVELISAKNVVMIKMNPKDLENTKLLYPEHQSRLLGFDRINFVADQTIELGGAVIESLGGHVDTQISTQIDNIVQHFVPGMGKQIKLWQQGPDKEETD